jgi:stage V sporulation protein SpoVS
MTAAFDALDPSVTLRSEPGGLEVVLVKGGSNIHSVAGSILHAIRNGAHQVETRSVGAGAVNQAAKACAVARQLAAKEGLELTLAPRFQDITMDNGSRTAVVFAVVVAKSA